MKTLDFVKKYLGKKVNPDGIYGYQCKDLVNQYIKEVQGETAPRGNAEDMFKADWGKHFIKIKNEIITIPQLGDVVIWNGKYCKYGHIAIIIQANANYMIILEQNGGSGNGDGKGNNAIRLNIKDYKNVIGFIRKKYI